LRWLGDLPVDERREVAHPFGRIDASTRALQHRFDGASDPATSPNRWSDPIMPESFAGERAPVNPPIDYLVAMWAGMPREQVLVGLREGWIRRPLGAGAEWLPLDEDGEDPGLDAAESSGIGSGTVRAWLARLDPTLDDATFDRMWREAGTSDASRTAALTTFAADALGVSRRVDSGERSPSRAIAQALETLHGTAKIVRIDGMNGSELERRAHEDAGVRRALATHSPWALTDHRNLARMADAVGRFDRFDSETGEVNVTDAWVGDRARHAAWRMADHDEAAQLHTSGDGWRFVDRAAGASATVEIEGDTGVVHQVLFARNEGDHVVGGTTTDRLHGGTGDDVLRGRGGDDLIEGGRGADLLHGGSGRDDLAGQQGDDELEGGAGADRLDGGSGSDELSGGRGNDLLRGGQGDDVYRFESGDGADVVEDDGGAIVLDDSTIAGAMQRTGEAWRSADGKLRFSLQDAGSTLVIESTEGGGNSIHVRGWSQRAYGITLDGLDQAPDEDPAPPRTEGDDDNRSEVSSGDASPSPDASMSPIEPPTESELGNEAPWGEQTWLGDDAQAGALSALATDPLGGAALIDTAALLQAFESWSVPSPPDIGSTASFAVNGVTNGDIADAVADDASDDGDAQLVMASGAEAWRSLPLSPESPIALPPDVLLQRTA
jgi:hypothetical protein